MHKNIPGPPHLSVYGLCPTSRCGWPFPTPTPPTCSGTSHRLQWGEKCHTLNRPSSTSLPLHVECHSTTGHPVDTSLRKRTIEIHFAWRDACPAATPTPEATPWLFAIRAGFLVQEAAVEEGLTAACHYYIKL